MSKTSCWNILSLALLFLRSRFQAVFEPIPVPNSGWSGFGKLEFAKQKRRADLKVLNPSKKVQDPLQLTKLYTVFDVYDDETIAIASFK